MNLLETAIFEADASTIKASIRHWHYKKEQTQLSGLHYRGLELPSFPTFSILLAPSQRFPLPDLDWETSHGGGIWDICALPSLRRASVPRDITPSEPQLCPWSFGQCLYSPDMKNKTKQNSHTQTISQRSLSLFSKIEGRRKEGHSRLTISPGSRALKVKADHMERDPGTLNCHHHFKFTSLGVSRWPPQLVIPSQSLSNPLGFLSTV